MYYRLCEGLALRGWDKLPYAIVDIRRAKTIFIRKREMDALEMCNGCIDLTLPLVPQYVRDMLLELEKNGIVMPCERGDGLRPGQAYERYPARYIETVHWSITGRCNYRCRHCYMSAPDAKYGELPHDTVMDIIEQLAACGIRRVSLTGGEPLVRADFMDIVDALRAHDIMITTIYSNCKLVTDDLLDALAARGCRPEFNMSFDGVGWHDWLRGVDGAERAARDAFLRCRERGFPTGVEMCLHRENVSSLRETVRTLGQWGCGSLKTNLIANVGAWKAGGYGESLSDESLCRTYLDYIPRYYEDGTLLSIQLGGFFSADPAAPDVFDIPVVKSCRAPDTTCICGHARLAMYLSADGRALPCMGLSGMDIQKEFPLVTENGLAASITDSRYMRLIDTRASEYLAHNPACAACEHALQCIGGCRAGALEGSPLDIMAPDLHTCRIFKGGWIPKIFAAVRGARPDATCRYTV